jgi:hypothetical protein
MLSVNPKGHMAGDPSDSHPKSRTWHPYSDKLIESAARRDRERFDYRRECAAFDRQRKRLNEAKRKGKVIYGFGANHA